MRYKYAQIGKIIRYNGVLLHVEETEDNTPVCLHCYFSPTRCQLEKRKTISCKTHGYACTASYRKDNRHVVFVKI